MGVDRGTALVGYVRIKANGFWGILVLFSQNEQLRKTAFL
jgi:hypothetical protein